MSRQPQFNFPKGIVLVPIIFVLIVLFSKSTVTVGSGERGVLYTLTGGVDTENPPLDEGFNVVAPWNKVFKYNVRQQELFEEKMSVLSSNGLEIKLDASVLYQATTATVALLHQTRGEEYEDDVIKPAVRSATRSVVGRYTPEQLYSTKEMQYKLRFLKKPKKY